jgi:hypothetical protein
VKPRKERDVAQEQAAAARQRRAARRQGQKTPGQLLAEHAAKMATTLFWFAQGLLSGVSLLLLVLTLGSGSEYLLHFYSPIAQTCHVRGPLPLVNSNTALPANTCSGCDGLSARPLTMPLRRAADDVLRGGLRDARRVGQVHQG